MSMLTSSWKLLQLGAVPNCSKKRERGYKAFCCARRDYNTLAQSYWYTEWRVPIHICEYRNSRIDQDHTVVDLVTLGQNNFSECLIGSKNDCCPTSFDLTDYHRVTYTDSSGSGDCANARCSPQKVEYARNKQGKGAAISSCKCMLRPATPKCGEAY